MDAVVAQIQDLFEGQIDFDGQHLAEQLYSAILSMSSVVALIVGYMQQDIFLTMWIGVAGTLLAMFLVVPPWPVYNRHPQSWLGSKASLPQGGIIVGGGKGR
ncbi:hypothetical protein A1O1_07461 [Capronia coronata CBS 617.96]|uniref:Signal peptidase complex subunit 1 n=1 Tax=Capronia coronata CBS 617.96 TaxID=1182541 RepID=W9YNM4_9EURO|nr:uncharacterized protein A1O1_07461 [Capronia coronata CBS 617.96]EXJ83834.1 hypothetical protein A1O1_07461 [Capronia coronata CBS 617.96]